jgi:hypothetical protein
MPKVEVCHVGPVPLAACTNAIVFCEFGYRDFHVMDLHPFNIAELDRLEREWLIRFHQNYERRARPPSLTDFV